MILHRRVTSEGIFIDKLQQIVRLAGLGGVEFGQLVRVLSVGLLHPRAVGGVSPAVEHGLPYRRDLAICGRKGLQS